MELVDPALQNSISSADLIEGLVTELPTSCPGSNKVDDPPAAIDVEEDIWEVEALLAKWQHGRRTLYLVTWKGFPHEANTWEIRNDIDPESVDKFDKDYLDDGGNHLGVELLERRVHDGRTEYLA